MPAWPAIRRRDDGQAVSRTVGKAMHRINPLRSPWHVAAVVCTAAVAGGCTMCPDPFDYSGPVPNGSSPQNDFRARSNGIRPLLAAPRPWPPVVENGAGTAPVGPGDGPTSSVVVAAAAETEEGRVVPVVREALEQPAAEDTDAGEPTGEPALEPVPETDSESPADPAASAAVTDPRDMASSDTAPDDDTRLIAASPPEAWPDVAPRIRPRLRARPAETAEPAPAALAVPSVAPQPAATAETPGWRPRR